MPSKQHDIEHAKTMMSNFNPDELKQIRDWVDNQLHDKDPDAARDQDSFSDKIDHMDEDKLTKLRQQIDNRLVEFKDDTLGSADPSADDEKKKHIAQHGADPNAQTSSQNVPQPVSNEVKDLQNEKSREEHESRGSVGNASH